MSKTQLQIETIFIASEYITSYNNDKKDGKITDNLSLLNHFKAKNPEYKEDANLKFTLKTEPNHEINGYNLTNIDFTGISLDGCIFNNCTLSQTFYDNPPANITIIDCKIGEQVAVNKNSNLPTNQTIDTSSTPKGTPDETPAKQGWIDYFKSFVWKSKTETKAEIDAKAENETKTENAINQLTNDLKDQQITDEVKESGDNASDTVTHS